MDPFCCGSVVQSADCSDVIVCGGFSWCTLGPLAPAEHYLNTTASLNVFDDHPFMATVYPSSDDWFQKDNAPHYKVSVISNWLVEPGSEVTVLKWPRLSPVPSPIEHLWDVLSSMWTNISEECFWTFLKQRHKELRQNEAAALLTRYTDSVRVKLR